MNAYILTDRPILYTHNFSPSHWLGKERDEGRGEGVGNSADQSNIYRALRIFGQEINDDIYLPF
jgi:hypothetical protein